MVSLGGKLTPLQIVSINYLRKHVANAPSSKNNKKPNHHVKELQTSIQHKQGLISIAIKSTYFSVLTILPSIMGKAVLAVSTTKGVSISLLRYVPWYRGFRPRPWQMATDIILKPQQCHRDVPFGTEQVLRDGNLICIGWTHHIISEFSIKALTKWSSSLKLKSLFQLRTSLLVNYPTFKEVIHPNNDHFGSEKHKNSLDKSTSFTTSTLINLTSSITSWVRKLFPKPAGFHNLNL